MWQDFKAWCKAHPRLISSATFFLFFLWLSSILEWPAALMLAVSLAIHEYSHVWAMKKIGMQIQGVFFIPFLGAVAMGGGRTLLSRKEEFLMAMAGPLMGYLSAIPVFAALVLTGNMLFYKTAYLIILLNLFNMLPLSPLDGGRMMKSVLMSLKNKTIGFGLWIVFAAAAIWLLTKVNVNIILMALIIWAAVSEFLNERKIQQIVEQSEKMSSRYIHLSEHERAAAMREMYCETREIVVLGEIFKRQVSPLNLKQGLLFALVYIILAGWPFVFYFLAR